MTTPEQDLRTRAVAYFAEAKRAAEHHYKGELGERLRLLGRTAIPAHLHETVLDGPSLRDLNFEQEWEEVGRLRRAEGYEYIDADRVADRDTDRYFHVGPVDWVPILAVYNGATGPIAFVAAPADRPIEKAEG